MTGSGLKDILALIYAENISQHILLGKAVAQALWECFLIDAALNNLPTLQAFGMNKVECDGNSVTIPELKDAGTLILYWQGQSH